MDPQAYLDYNATTPIDPRVLSKMLPYLTNAWGNPASRDHFFGWDAAEAVEEARSRVASLINAKPREIVFTGCATESINLALKGIARANNQPKRITIVTSAIEHEAVLGSCWQLESAGDTRVSCLPVDRSGDTSLDELTRVTKDSDARLVSIMLANNEIGKINPIRETARMAHDCGAFFFTDITQAAGKIPIDVRADGVDLAAFSAHKMYGPKGVGALFIRAGDPKIELEPLITGGGQERGLRSGTLNVPGIVGFGEACRIAAEETQDDAESMGRLRDKLEQRLLTELPDVYLNGEPKNRLPNTSNMRFDGVDARTLIRDLKVLAVSTRSACSSGAQGPSHVLKALGLTDEQCYSSIRFSLGRFTSEEEIDRAVELVTGSVRKLRRHRVR